MKIGPMKAAGPDGIPTWVLRDIAGYLAQPVASIFNSSLREGQLPFQWKCADICTHPKGERSNSTSGSVCACHAAAPGSIPVAHGEACGN